MVEIPKDEEELTDDDFFDLFGEELMKALEHIREQVLEDMEKAGQNFIESKRRNPKYKEYFDLQTVKVLSLLDNDQLREIGRSFCGIVDRFGGVRNLREVIHGKEKKQLLGDLYWKLQNFADTKISKSNYLIQCNAIARKENLEKDQNEFERAGHKRSKKKENKSEDKVENDSALARKYLILDLSCLWQILMEDILDERRSKEIFNSLGSYILENLKDKYQEKDKEQDCHYVKRRK